MHKCTMTYPCVEWKSPLLCNFTPITFFLFTDAQRLFYLASAEDQGSMPCITTTNETNNFKDMARIHEFKIDN